MNKKLERKINEIKESCPIIATICLTISIFFGIITIDSLPLIFSLESFIICIVTVCLGISGLIYDCKTKDKGDILLAYGMCGGFACICLFILLLLCSIFTLQGFSWLFLPIILLGLCVLMFVHGDKINKPKELERQRKVHEEFEQKALLKMSLFKDKLSLCYSDLGEPTIDICFHEEYFSDKGLMSRKEYYYAGYSFKSILVWPQQQMFLLLTGLPSVDKKPLHFSSLKSINLIDDIVESPGYATQITKTNTANMVKRGIVGGVLLGGAGAIIGAATAKTETTTKFNPNLREHNYSLALQLNDFAMPSIVLKFGRNEKQMRKVYDTLQVIMNRK